MSKICTIFGHREIWEDKEQVYNDLYFAVENEILLGIDEFWLGGRGEIDYLAIKVCKNLRDKYKHIKLYLALSNFNLLKKKFGVSYLDYIKDMKTLYFNTEDVFYKKQISERNKQMVNGADVLICYVDFSRYKSGAKTAVMHALKQGKKVINIFKEKEKLNYTREEFEKQLKEYLLKPILYYKFIKHKT